MEGKGLAVVMFIVFSLIILLSFQEAFADTKTWIGSIGNWNVDSNWSPTGIPTSTDNVIIDSGTVTLDINYISLEKIYINAAKLIIPNGITLSNSGNEIFLQDLGGQITINQGGRLNNNALLTLNLGGSIINSGNLINSDTIQLVGFGLLKNELDGILDNNGLIEIVAASGFGITNIGIFNNNNHLVITDSSELSNAEFNNYGIFNNVGNVDASERFNNQGTVNNNQNGIFNAKNAFTNEGIFNNKAMLNVLKIPFDLGPFINKNMLNNFAGGIITIGPNEIIDNTQGIFNNFCGGIIINPIQVTGNEIIYEFCPIGGELIPIDKTSLLLAEAQTTASWMIPIVLSGIGIGFFVVFRRSENS